MNKTYCDVCGKELEKIGYGKYEHRGPNTISWKGDWDLCEEHSLPVFEFIYKMRQAFKKE